MKLKFKVKTDTRGFHKMLKNSDEVFKKKREISFSSSKEFNEKLKQEEEDIIGNLFKGL